MTAERKTIDSRFSIRGTEKPPSNVVIVAIDDKTFNDLQFNWPFPRAYHAGVINRLHKDGAKAILDRQTFERVQDLLKSNRITRRIKHSESGALLLGKLYDDRGNLMSPSFSSKNGVRYRFYVSSALLRGR